jgi:hypothetical protein
MKTERTQEIVYPTYCRVTLFSFAGGRYDLFWLDNGDDGDQSRKFNFASGVFYRPTAAEEPPSPRQAGTNVFQVDRATAA